MSILAKRDVLVGLELLKPCAETELVTTFGQRDAILISVQIARNAQITAVVAAGQPDRRLRIRRGAASHNHGADLVSNQKSGYTCGRRSRSRFAIEKISGSRIADARDIQERGRENVSFFHTENLRAQIQNIGAVGISRRSCHVAAIVNGIDSGQ